MPNLSSPKAIAIQKKDHNPSSKSSSDPNGKIEMSVVSWNCENCHVNNEAKDLFCLECYFKKPDDRKMEGQDEPIDSPSTSVNISLDLLEVDRPTGHSDGHHDSCLKEFVAMFTTPLALAAEAILLVMITITTLLNIELYSTGGLNGSSGCIVTYDAQAYRFKSFSVDNIFLYRYESYPNINNITDTVRAATLALTRITMAWNIAMFTMVCGAVFFFSLGINEQFLSSRYSFRRNAVICFGWCGYLGALFGGFGGIVSLFFSLILFLLASL